MPNFFLMMVRLGGLRRVCVCGCLTLTLLVVLVLPAHAVYCPPAFSPDLGEHRVEAVRPRSSAMEKAGPIEYLVDLPALSTAEQAVLKSATCPTCSSHHKRLPIGLDRECPLLPPDQLGVSAAQPVVSVTDGQLLLLRMRSRGARGIRLLFDRFSLAPQQSVVVYNPLQPTEVVGPYTAMGPNNQGHFYSGTIYAEEVVVELFSPAPIRSCPFEITRLNHLVADPREFAKADLYCHEDIRCFSEYNLSSAVGRISFIEDSVSYLCTGALLNNLVADNWTPFFLTADHCISSSAVADTVEVTWRYTSRSCDGPVDPLDSFSTTYGADFLGSSPVNDFCLLVLEQDPPPGTLFLGWNTEIFPNGSDVFAIHHPNGEYQRFSRGQLSNGPFAEPLIEFETDRDFFYVVDWSLGATEGGSSGSPLLMAGGVVIGQLFGGDENTCPDTSGKDAYGKFFHTYNTVGAYLTGDQPLPTWTVTLTPTMTATPSVTSTLTPTATESPTQTETPTPTFSVTLTDTATTTPTSTATSTETPSPGETLESTATEVPQPTVTDTASYFPQESATPTAEFTAAETVSPSATDLTTQPTGTVSETSTETATNTSVLTPLPTATPPLSRTVLFSFVLQEWVFDQQSAPAEKLLHLLNQLRDLEKRP